MATLQAITQYLTFELAGESYGIEVTSIREILEMRPITRVPRAASYLLGVMNVRGRVVPVVDLRSKFGLESAPETVDSAIIVLETAESGGDSLIGLLVDRVDEVLELDSEDIEPAPTVGTAVDSRLLGGMGKKDEQFILLLDTGTVFSAEDADALKPASET